MKRFEVATLLAVCFVVIAFAYDSSAVKAAPAVSPIKSASFTRADGSKLNFVANVEKGHVGVAFLKGGKAIGYSAFGADLRGSIVLSKASTFGEMDGPEKVRVTIVSLDDKRVKIKVVPLEEGFQNVAFRTSGDDDFEGELDPGYNCQTPSGTGPCNNVNTDADWWRCFRCCLAIGGCAPFEN